MRNLTIKRTKTFVACLAKANVYIEDENNYDLIINNTPCRKLGTLKNGEEKTFEISEASARVYVIADKLSKGICNEFIEIPYGEEDVTITGKNRFNILAGNPFRFDGEVSAEVLANRKRSNRKGAVVLAIAAIIGFIIGFVSTSGLLGNGIDGAPKDFSASGMTVTLTDDFKVTEYDGYEIVCETNKVVMFALKEEFTLLEGLENWSIDKYAETANTRNTEIQHKDGLTFFEYDAKSDKTYHYFVYAFKTDDAFWLIQFATVKSEAENCREHITNWAKSVKFD